METQAKQNQAMPIDIKDLTPEQRESLLNQLKTDMEQQALRKKRERDTYEELKSMAITDSFDLLVKASQLLIDTKEQVFQNFSDILSLKKGVFNLTDEQMDRQESHSFTTQDGKITIILGANTIDKWDETVDVGVLMVKDYLKTLAKDEASGHLVGMITDLLKPNKDGVLKANRVLDLAKKASEIGDAKLIEAVEIIRNAYRPTKTSTYIKARFKNEKNEDVYLPLSISSI
jgi:hypothetical protein